jgi:DNA-binding transcriptional ArsR family regulator
MIRATLDRSHPLTQITRKTEARADIIKAMAHPARLFMMEELAKGERCVCDLREMVGSDLSTVSKHLSVLRNAGLVNIDKRGPQVFYSLTTPCVLRFLDCIDAVVRSNAERQMELVE